MVSADTLGTYLNDHLAGATAGSELAQKMSSENAGTPLAIALSTLAQEIEEDRVTLQNLTEQVGVAKNPVKEAGGWLMEKLSRVKLSDAFAGKTDLRHLLEFETLSLGVEGKLAMWRALAEVRDQHAALDTVDLDGLVKRAENQRATIEEQRLRLAGQALAP